MESPTYHCATVDLALQNMGMRKLLLLLFLVIAYYAQSQTLTVEKIMQDPKWIGTSPTNVFWSYDSKTLYFKWNPEKAISDSFYSYQLNAKVPVKVAYNEGQLAQAIYDGTYNKRHTQVAYAYKGDIYWLDIPSNRTIRITLTADYEKNPTFVLDDAAIVYQAGNNLYLHDIKTGFTRQLTGF